MYQTEIEGEGGASCRNTQTEVQEVPEKVLPFYQPSYQAPTYRFQKVKFHPGNYRLPIVSSLFTASCLLSGNYLSTLSP